MRADYGKIERVVHSLPFSMDKIKIEQKQLDDEFNRLMRVVMQLRGVFPDSL